MLLAFDLIANWCWKEQRNLLPMNQLYILFLIFYINFFKREFWIFSNEHFDRLHSTKFSIATREFYIWEALCQVKHPCRPFSLTLTLILVSIQLSATEFFFHQFFICSEQFLFFLFFFVICNVCQTSQLVCSSLHPINYFHWKVGARQLVR